MHYFVNYIWLYINSELAHHAEIYRFLGEICVEWDKHSPRKTLKWASQAHRAEIARDMHQTDNTPSRFGIWVKKDGPDKWDGMQPRKHKTKITYLL